MAKVKNSVRRGFKNINYLFLISLMLISKGFNRKKCKSYFDELKDKELDVIVVPGMSFQDGKWSELVKQRVHWAVYLYQNGIAKHIIFSGSDVYSPYKESKIMARYAEGLGIPKEHIFVETKAEHSTENIQYAMRMIDLLGFKSWALASDPYQTKMLNKYIEKKMDVKVPLLPLCEIVLEEEKYEMKDIEIEFDDLLIKDYIPIKEREGFFKRLRGTMGNNVNPNYYRKLEDIEEV